MKNALLLKFGQNENMGLALKETGNLVLAEASQFDNYWGIGFSLKNASVKRKDEWGQNKLGLLLMEVRKELFGKNTAS